LETATATGLRHGGNHWYHSTLKAEALRSKNGVGKGMANAVRFLLSLLAIHVALNSVYDIRVLFVIDRGQSDAATMARLFLLPSWVWATAWMLMSVAMLGATLWMTRGR
jgi:hypothetical protein